MASRPRGPPIDRGWAWVVMAAVFLNMMFCIGFVRSFGILFIEFQLKYQTSSSVTALIMGVQGGVFSVAGFLAQSVMTSYLSARTTVMLGGFLASAGVILSYFANSIPILILTQSLGVGCGNAFIIGPGLVLLGKYFDKHRSLAIAIANTGANVGAITMPQLIRYLLDEFGLGGVFLIYGALMLHIVASGALLRPIESYKCAPVVSDKASNGDKEDDNQTCENCKSEINKNGVPEINKNCVPEIRITAPEESRLLSTDEGEECEKPRLRTTSASNRTFKDFMESYSESSAVKYTSTPDLACLSVQDVSSSTGDKGTTKVHGCRAWLEKVLDFSLFKLARFYLILLVAVFGVLGGALMGVYVPAFGADKNATKQEAATMLSANGAAGGVSRIGVGFFADRGIMKRNHILALALTVAALTGCVAPVYKGFGSLMAFSVVNGFFAALYFSLIPVVIVDFLGLPKLSKTFGFLQLVHGASMAAAHPIAGLLRDITGSFDVPYIFFGSSSLIAAFLLMLEPCASRFDNRELKKATNNESKEMAALTSDEKL